jgi:hypothetical protein
MFMATSSAVPMKPQRMLSGTFLSRKGKRMTDKKQAEAKRKFNVQAVTEAVERMRLELVLASKAAHSVKLADAGDDEEYEHFDRVVELGYLVDIATDLCGAHLILLWEIANVLHGLEGGDEGAGKEQPHNETQTTKRPH